MEQICAWEKFGKGFAVKPDRGTLTWRPFDQDFGVAANSKLSPGDVVAGVSVGSPGTNDEASLMISSPSFGRVIRLLAEEGETVHPGQPLLEFEPRPPTLQEWEALQGRAWAAERRLRDLEGQLRNPLRAAWESTRRWRRAGQS